MVGNFEEAEDLVQETFLRDVAGPATGSTAWTARPALRDRHNTCLDAVKRIRRRPPVERLLTSEARYSAREIADRSGLDLDFFLAHRRALGLAVPEPAVRVYGEQDLESARMGKQYRQAGLPDDDAMEAQHVLGRGMARARRVSPTSAG